MLQSITLSPRAILLIDDDAAFRDRVRRLLEDELVEARLEEAEDAETGVRRALEGAWDVVVVDLSLPGKSGLAAIQEIRAGQPTLPLLAVSSSPRDPFSAITRRLGANGYVQKQDVSDELVPSLRQVVLEHRTK